ncbi:MAG: hypothetical protein HRT47_07960 [Candidatus Caenarcaniphilales bacterium]|nr:hypothetical protein [Candidatus Caenarcaniphilales bacterium]
MKSSIRYDNGLCFDYGTHLINQTGVQVLDDLIYKILGDSKEDPQGLCLKELKNFTRKTLQ